MVYSTEERSEIEEKITEDLVGGVTVRFEDEIVFLEDDTGTYKFVPRLQEDVVYMVNPSGEDILAVESDDVDSYRNLVLQAVNNLIWGVVESDSLEDVYDNLEQWLEGEERRNDELLKNLDEVFEE